MPNPLVTQSYTERERERQTDRERERETRHGIGHVKTRPLKIAIGVNQVSKL